ncbi:MULTISPECIES: M20 family metallopeptidase [unclassified Jeotgalicoccus]|uniref:M20 family metallopeptidase n=1 Tax=unclassified Jeotgalicoccus TaxID=2630462 RepID=UPI001414DE25|nr:MULTISPECIES: M20 family metallopeptidase [unclassified Jeotgalicoccus]QQD84599.1 amidohydrolase [Jeotgalicoccus sp. ATCC 8456]
METLFASLDELNEEIISIRRHLHQHPELSFEEVETPKYIAEFHEVLGHEVRTSVGGNGVVAYLKGEHDGPTVALRADFDALPIEEETELDFKSVNEGVMHACGHDGHTATLLGVAKALNKHKNELHGNVVFIHQHAEELPPGGAKPMIEDGALEGVDVIFGTHLQAQLPLNEIAYRTDALQASSDSFEVKILGKGGHGAMPQDTKDSILIASQLVNNFQQIVSRRVNPLQSAVLSVCSFEAIGPYNIIANTAKIKGTVRTLNEETRELMEQEMERVIKGTCELSGADYEFNYERGYPVLINHKEETEFVVKVAETVPDVATVKEIEPIMGGEDYSYYLQEVKGTYIFTGAQPDNTDNPYPHHHPKFDINEKALLTAAKVLAKSTVEYMNQNK